MSLTAAAGLIVIGLVLTRVTLENQNAIGAGALPEEDAARIGVHVQPVDGGTYIPRDQALASAAARWTDGRLGEAFLQLLTDPDTARSADPLTDRPIWVVRYSGLSVVSPGGRVLRYAYVLIDAETGREILTKWSP